MIKKVEGWMLNSMNPIGDYEEENWNGLSLKVEIRKYSFAKLDLSARTVVYSTSEFDAWNQLRGLI